MSIRVKESFAITLPRFNEAATQRVVESLLPNGGSVLEVTFAAIHEGLTRNNTFYSKEGLTSHEKDNLGQPGGLDSWVNPYNAPILLNHDATDVKNVIGRVQEAKWIEKVGKTPGHVEIRAHITHPESIEKILRGEYETGSIGMDVDTAGCSICGENLKENAFGGMFHPHQRGKWYFKAPKEHEQAGEWIEAAAKATGAKRMQINIGNVWAREYSLVAVPSDMRSKLKSMAMKEASFFQGKESLDMVTGSLLESETSEVEETEVSMTTPPVVTDGVKPDRSVAELYGEFPILRKEFEADPCTRYFELLSYKLALEAGVPDNDSSMGMNIEGILPAEAEKLATYILQNNEHLEEELLAIQDTVLSTSNEGLPDSSFALVKTIGEKKLVALPYKKEDGTVEKSRLLIGLARWAWAKGFDSAEKARGLAKLERAAKKAGLGEYVRTADELSQDIKEAQDFLVANGVEVATGLSTTVDTLETKISELEATVVEYDTLLAEREEESDRLLEQVSEAKELLKTQLVTQLLELEAPAEGEEFTSRETELTALTHAELTSRLSEVTKEKKERIIITSKASSAGIAIGDEADSPARGPVLDRETMISALLNSPRNQRKIIEEVTRSRR